ncbi:hypothetical protein K1T71_000316 [Dendrolimus kikuchii]|uniref:Uncharacterized protein n=1 Tax=Dendrolimus kikuchii TaxID=765133 RepID=A0ACC1DIW5_9NEOP|nr:hypothetical protein K1T71_000316 [Dendrolimus kikuchii]
MDLCNNSDGNIGLKVNGDLGDFEIVEETSESDNDNDQETENCPRIRSLSTLPVDLIKPSSTPIFGSVQVTGSQNVQFGNNTYFNGPVTIKQVISDTFGVDNASYVKTEEEDLPAQRHKNEPKNDNSVIKSFQCKLWYKLTFSALVIVLLGSICGVVVLIFSKNRQDNSGTTSFNDDSTNGTGLVVGLCYENLYQIFIVIIISVSLTILLVYSLLTMEAFIYDKSQVVEQVQNETKSRRIKHNHFDKKYKDAADDPLLIAPNHLRIVSRSEWLAQPVENELDKIRQPVPWVIITHTATESCTTQSECLFRVRLIQTYHIESRKWFDIGYNFLVAGDGSAYYGRGWDYIGAHTLGYNKYSIGIAFIGTFNNEAPPKKQIEACEKLIKRGVELGKISKDYKLFAHRQLASTLSPGDKLYDIIKEWPHFVRNTTDISSLIPDY